MSKAFGVRKVMDGIKNVFPSWRESRERSASVPTCRTDFFDISSKVDEYAAASRQRVASRMDWVPTKSGPNPQTEPTSTSSEEVAMYGPAVVHKKGMVLSLDGSSVGSTHGANETQHGIRADLDIGRSLGQASGTGMDYHHALHKFLPGAVQR